MSDQNEAAVSLHGTAPPLDSPEQRRKAMEQAKVDSPRGTFTLSKAHNPVQDFYLRKVDGRENKLGAVAVKALADPARGCRL